MISRRTALVLGIVYEREFSRPVSSRSRYPSSERVFQRDRLYDFLFEKEYDAWFCNKLEGLYSPRDIREFIMQLHTGETLSSGTPDLTWPQRETLGQRYLKNLAEDILNQLETSKYISGDHASLIKSLVSNLELDGYIYSDSQLLIPESDIFDSNEEKGILESLFRLLNLANDTVALHHLDLSEQHYIDGLWDDSISNSRKFLECVLQEVAANHSQKFKNTDLSESTYSWPAKVREYLEKEGLLESKETVALKEMYGLLSHTGSHPYIAQNDQARLLRHMALTFSQFVMLRYQGYLKTKNPTPQP